MPLFYINCMCEYRSVKSSYELSFRVEKVFGQNILLCTCIWPKRPWPKRPGQNVRGQNVRPPPGSVFQVLACIGLLFVNLSAFLSFLSVSLFACLYFMSVCLSLLSTKAASLPVSVCLSFT